MGVPPQPERGTLHAVLREVEQGLYRAEYRGELNPRDSDARDVPDFHIGTDAAGVKKWVEEMAAGLGYEKVVWDRPEAT